MRNLGLIFHSDRGVQYSCNNFVNLLPSYGITQSMCRKGNCWDNAVAGSVFQNIKVRIDLRKQACIKRENENNVV